MIRLCVVGGSEPVDTGGGSLHITHVADPAALATGAHRVACDVMLVRGPDPEAVARICKALDAAHPTVPIVAALPRTADTRTLVATLRAGADDTIIAPVQASHLQDALARVLNRAARRRAAHQAGRGAAAPDLHGESTAIKALRARVERVASVPSSVLLVGESGTGKELVARALHTLGSRRGGPFVPVDCAALPETLLESELFGHVAGAFTDARADRDGLFVRAEGGTVFLDEVGELPASLQAKLLRVLQERTVRPVGAGHEVAVDARVIAATHRDLDGMVAAGAFRADLLYRLDVVRLALPSLRERRADILPLARRFLARLGAELPAPVLDFDSEAAHCMVHHPWPGNVRELQNCVEHAAVLADGPLITLADLPHRLRGATAAASVEPAPDGPPALLTLAEVERRHIERVLRHVDGNRVAAAKVLGVDRKTLYRKLQASKRDTGSA